MFLFLQGQPEDFEANPDISQEGESKLNALEDEQARIDVRGGTFPAERRMPMIRAHNIQKTGIRPGNDARTNTIEEAAYQRYLAGNKNPETRLQQLRDYYKKQNQRIVDAVGRGDQAGVRNLHKEEASPRGQASPSERNASPDLETETLRAQGLDQIRRKARARALQEAQDAQAAEQKGPTPMDRSKFLFFLVCAGILDAIEFFTAGTIGWVIALIGDFFLYRAIGPQFKNARTQLNLLRGSILLEKIPVVLSTLPIRSIVMLYLYFSSQHPNITKVATMGASKFGEVKKQP